MAAAINIPINLQTAGASSGFQALQSQISQLQTQLNALNTTANANQSSGGGLSGGFTRGAAAAGAFAMAGAKALEVVVSGIKEGIAAGAEFAKSMEESTLKFKVLLGSAEAAKTRMAELNQFAAKTPFELNEVVSASRVLQTFGGNALATGDSLRRLGDAAAGSGAPMQELAVTFGRAVDGIRSGRAIGESLARFQELGIISGKARSEIERLQKANQGMKAELLLNKEMDKFKGTMADLSTTWTGVMSTLKDTWASFMSDLLVDTGIFDSLKDGMVDLSTTIGEVAQSQGFANFKNGILGIVMVVDTLKMAFLNTADIAIMAFKNVYVMISGVFEILGTAIGGLVAATAQLDFKHPIESSKKFGEVMGWMYDDVKKSGKEMFDGVEQNAMEMGQNITNRVSAYTEQMEKLGQKSITNLQKVGQKAVKETKDNSKVSYSDFQGSGKGAKDKEKPEGVQLLQSQIEAIRKESTLYAREYQRMTEYLIRQTGVINDEAMNTFRKQSATLFASLFGFDRTTDAGEDAFNKMNMVLYRYQTFVRELDKAKKSGNAADLGMAQSNMKGGIKELTDLVTGNVGRIGSTNIMTLQRVNEQLKKMLTASGITEAYDKYTSDMDKIAKTVNSHFARVLLGSPEMTINGFTGRLPNDKLVKQATEQYSAFVTEGYEDIYMAYFDGAEKMMDDLQSLQTTNETFYGKYFKDWAGTIAQEVEGALTGFNYAVLENIDTDSKAKALENAKNYFDAYTAIVKTAKEDFQAISESSTAKRGDQKGMDWLGSRIGVDNEALKKKISALDELYTYIDEKETLKVAAMDEGLQKQLAEIDLLAEAERVSYQKKYDALNGFLDGQAMLQEVYNLKVEGFERQRNEKSKKWADEQRERNINNAKTVANTFGSLLGNASSYYREEMSLNEKNEGKKREYRQKYKAFAIAEATISGAVAAIETYKSLAAIPVVGPALGAAGAAGIAALTAGKIAQIESQKFANGGMIGGRNTLIRANENGQESILNAAATRRLGSAGVAYLNNGGSLQGSGQNVEVTVTYSPVINGGASTDMAGLLKDHSREIAEIVNDSIRRGYVQA